MPDSTLPIAELCLERIDSFEAGISWRAELPRHAARDVVFLSDKELRRQALATTQILERFAAAVETSTQHGAATETFVQSLDLKLVSRDHDWRNIFQWLREEAQAGEAHKLVAMRGYLQFLNTRVELLEAVRSKREALAATNETKSIRAFLEEAREQRDTRRLPKGETVDLAIPYRGEITLWFGHHPFLVQDGYPPQLIDPAGNSYPLSKGRSCVGRHVENDIVIDSQFGDVSRAHLIVEWVATPVLRLTDLSSRGTFVEKVCETDCATEHTGNGQGSAESAPTTRSQTSNVHIGAVHNRRGHGDI